MGKRGLIVLLLLVVAACQQQAGPAPEAAFIGGQVGLQVEFQPDAPPKEVYDGGRFPFAVVVKLQNLGEFFVPKDKVKVTLSGIQAQEFGLTSTDLVRNPVDDLIARRKDPVGNVIESNPSFLEFRNLNRQQRITGSALVYPLRADVCYNYGTLATAKLCSRQSILNPAPGGICQINEEKPVANSGAPVQIVSLLESARAQDKIAFTFKMQHVGSGALYRRGSGCDKSQVVRVNEQRVFVSVREPQNVECVGLQGTARNEGEVTLFDGSNTVTCTVNLEQPGDFEFPLTIDLNYDYENTVTTSFVVKRSEQ
ncbi:hypothetical protein HY641_02535 [Candidatus Woesearchaeota archaeon]|nr:hypothetical protein [Candidatus Woesearchaeota archaeon]